ncbi:MAG: class I SAM-dependent methyltransferase [Desulfobacterales bacterium]|nr:MAG: class I SAM-dependent methyltransferase [Desulfobacterales bacterium]
MKLNWAERWVVNNPLRVFQQRLEIRWLKRMMPLEPGATIMEIGCGRGAGAKLIVQEFQPSLLHVLDLDIEMMLKAKNVLSTMPKERVKLYVGDSINLPFKAGTLDAIFGFGFLHHVPDWRRALSEIARVLKNGGIYYIEELYPTLYQNVVTKHILVHPDYDRFTSHDLRTMLHEMNLHLASEVELPKMGILGVAIRSDH